MRKSPNRPKSRWAFAVVAGIVALGQLAGAEGGGPGTPASAAEEACMWHVVRDPVEGVGFTDAEAAMSSARTDGHTRRQRAEQHASRRSGAGDAGTHGMKQREADEILRREMARSDEMGRATEDRRTRDEVEFVARAEDGQETGWFKVLRREGGWILVEEAFVAEC